MRLEAYMSTFVSEGTPVLLQTLATFERRGLEAPQRQGLVMGIAAAGNSSTVIANLAAPRLAIVAGWHNRRCYSWQC
jgi:hypothetical protein